MSTEQVRDVPAKATDDEPDTPTLNQISAYLISPAVIDYIDALRDPDRLTAVDIDPSSGLTGRLYVHVPEPRTPKWLEFLRTVTESELSFEGSRHVSAVLFIDRPVGRFALTFGFGRHLLDPEAIEPDYGLKVAAGLVDADELASVDSRSIEAVSVNVRRQSSRGSRLQSIGFDVGREMLRALAGRLPDEALGRRITGSDSVGLSAELDASTLGGRLDALHGVYSAGTYRTSGFRHIDRWGPMSPGPRRDELNAFLVESLEKRREAVLAGEDRESLPGPSKSIHLGAPWIIDYRASGFIASTETGVSPHPFPDLDAYLGTLDRRPPTEKDLRSNHLLLISDEPDEVVESWTIFRALNWDVEYDGETYILGEGNWWHIDGEYRARIDDQLREIPQAALVRPDFDPQEWEVDYNERLALAGQPGRAMLDRVLARFQGETGPVEICDVFTSERQFVHVKRGVSSAALSHLFGQALVSARLFLRFPEFRERFREVLTSTEPGLTDLVPVGRPDTAVFEVVMGIVTTLPDPVALEMPFFARNHLAQVVPDIEAMGYRVSIARIDERLNARPAGAGDLYRVRHPARSRAGVVRAPGARRAIPRRTS